MSRNGSGTYTFPATTWDPAVNGVTATAADWNTREADVAAALTASVAKDGQTAMTGNLPMGGNRITGLASAVASTDAATKADVSTIIAATPLRSYLAGLVLSTAGSSATFAVAAGSASDSTNAALMTLAASVSKTTGAWALGSAVGGLDTGAIANSTWYHAYLIRRPDTGVVDVVFSISASAPTLPTNYTQYRRIGSMKTNGSAQWTSFTQDGDFFQWATPVLDVNASSTGTAAVSRTLSVPTGVNLRAFMNAGGGAGATGESIYLSDLSTSDLAPSNGNPLQTVFIAPSLSNYTQAQVRTNTSAQIRSRCVVGGASEALRIATLGWYDTRGRDA